MPQDKTETLYNLVVKNRPGELVKLTKLLTDANVTVSGLRVADLGDKASIQFSAPKGCALPPGFRKASI